MTNRNTTISIVMAEYNTNISHLYAAIESILHQSFMNYELIIVDDSSSNNMRKIVKKYDDNRIRLITNDKNRGLVFSLNYGIKHANGKYIVRMDTDDIAHPNRLEVLYNFINNNPSYAVVGSRVVEFSERGDRGILSTPGLKEKKSIIRGDGPVHPSVIMNKSLIESVGGYPDYIRAEDFALWSEVLLMGYKIFVLEDVLLHYRVNTVDYSKRRLKYRGGEIRAKLHYFPLLDARFTDYLLIIKSVIAGVVPVRFIEFYRRKKVFKNE